MANRGTSEGVDPIAATLHVRQESQVGPEPLTLFDKKSKQYSATKKNPRRVEAGGADIGEHQG